MRDGGWRAVALAAVVLSTGLTVTGWTSAAPAAAADRVLCTIRDPRIDESSGLAAAGDSLYTTNDGGSELRVFVLDRSCRVRRVITNPTNPYDVEDLARGADGTLWLADTGDNDQDRSTVAVERLRPDGSATLLRLRYPDGPHDAEALLLGADGALFVLTKEPLSSTVYTPVTAPRAGATTALRKVTTLSFGPTGTAGGPVGVASQVLVTGGAVAPSGRLVAVRTYTDAYVWAAPDGDVEAALRGAPRRIPLPATAQGEAVAFAPDGRSLLTSTEGVPGAVHQVDLPGELVAASAASSPGAGSGSSPGSDSSPGSGPQPGAGSQPGSGSSTGAGSSPGAGSAAGSGSQPGSGASSGPGSGSDGFPVLPVVVVGGLGLVLLLGGRRLLRR